MMAISYVVTLRVGQTHFSGKFIIMAGFACQGRVALNMEPTVWSKTMKSNYEFDKDII